MHEYEVAYILDPGLSEEEITANVTRYVDIAKSAGAEVKEPERWERRRLAYPIKDKREGVYVFMQMKASKEAVAEVSRVLKLADPVLRQMAIRLDED